MIAKKQALLTLVARLNQQDPTARWAVLKTYTTATEVGAYPRAILENQTDGRLARVFYRRYGWEISYNWRRPVRWLPKDGPRPSHPPRWATRAEKAQRAREAGAP